MSVTNNSQFSPFDDDVDRTKTQSPAVKPIAAGVARVLMPNRSQVELRPVDLESMLPEGHRARIVWAYVGQVDLSRVYAAMLLN